jgi:hypothetical protein
MSEPVSANNFTVKQSDLYRSRVIRFTHQNISGDTLSWSPDYPFVIEKIWTEYQGVQLAGADLASTQVYAALYPATFSVPLAQLELNASVATDKYYRWDEVNMAFPSGTSMNVYATSSLANAVVAIIVLRRLEQAVFTQVPESKPCDVTAFIERCWNG